MKRSEMINILVRSSGIKEETKVAEYRKYLEAKTDLELQNMVMINCF